VNWSSAYRGRRVFVTGLTGFKGVWLGLWLERLGAEVIGLALPPDEPMLRGWPGLADRFNCTTTDIRDPLAVRDQIHAARPDIVFHLAAQPLVRLSYQQPVDTFATNVLGTAHVLDALRTLGPSVPVVNVTSDKCYENHEWAWGYREDEAMGGHDPYSASKGCAELVASAYRRSFGLRIASGRAGNVIGGGDWAADRLVPDLVRAVMAARPLVLRRPNALRPWQHVLEPLCGYLTLGARLLNGDTRAEGGWNFGPAEVSPLTVREVADLLVKHWGRGEVVIDEDPNGPHEAHHLRLDSSKAAVELGWRAVLTPAERVAWTVDWYKAWQTHPSRGWRIAAEQIEQYERVAG
jgi:CDP-glucose 4,6-dehydratase